LVAAREVGESGSSEYLPIAVTRRCRSAVLGRFVPWPDNLPDH